MWLQASLNFTNEYILFSLVNVELFLNSPTHPPQIPFISLT